MVKRYIRNLFKSIVTSYHRIKGIAVNGDCRISVAALITRGYLNGRKGQVTIHEHCELSKGAVLKAYGGSISLGKSTFLGEYVVIYGHGGVQIGDNTLIAMHTCIVSSNHMIPDKKTLIRSQGDILLPVKIGNDVWIGAGAKILGGVTIGDGCVVGAGAVVTGDLPPYSVAIGVPAVITRYRND